MPSFDLTTGEWIILGVTIALVILPSRLASIGNFVGRVVSGRK